MYAKVLVPLENAPSDETIIAHVIGLAGVHRLRVILVHVADGFAARYQDALNLEDSDEIRADRDYLAKVLGRLEGEGIGGEALLEQGDPATRLVAVAEERGCDLIAMATHRHGVVQDVLRGSVAHSVRHKTLIPVLMVPSR